MAISAAEHPTPALPVWAPTQEVREALVQTLAVELSSPSGILERYGAPLPLEEAATVSRCIERGAFAAVSPPAPAADGMDTLVLYCKEISERVFEFCGARRAATSTPPTPPPLVLEPSSPDLPAASGAEEAPPLE